VGKTPDRIARLGIARTFQNIELFANATVMDNLMLGRHIHMKTGVFTGAALWEDVLGRLKRNRQREIVEASSIFGVAVRPDHYVASCPTANEARGLGRALALKRSLLLMNHRRDEHGRKGNLTSGSRLSGRLPVTILLIEHEMNMIWAFPTGLAINHGRKSSRDCPGGSEPPE
jgi:branched-chain amino acid transport system ATP-binding protein